MASRRLPDWATSIACIHRQRRVSLPKPSRQGYGSSTSMWKEVSENRHAAYGEPHLLTEALILFGGRGPLCVAGFYALLPRLD